MKTREAIAMGAVLSLLGTAPAPASVKPCRDAAGRIIACAKPHKPPPAPRCKDEHGRFAACAPAAAAGTPPVPHHDRKPS